MTEATPSAAARWPQHSALVGELIELNGRLLESIVSGDWPTYQELCDPTLTAFEPEARGHLVMGMAFHEFYFRRGKPAGPTAQANPATPPQATMCSPHVRLLGDDTAVISYVRLVQKVDPDGAFVTTATEETRVWQRHSGVWRHVHFHRSQNG